MFNSNKKDLLNLVEKRNIALRAKTNRTTRRSTENLRAARKNLKSQSHVPKANGLRMYVIKLTTKRIFGKAQELLGQHQIVKKRYKQGGPRTTQMMMSKEDGSKCKSSLENAEVFRTHFAKLYNHSPAFDPALLNLLEQHPTIESAGRTPDVDEIRNAIYSLRNKAPGSSGLTP